MSPISVEEATVAGPEVVEAIRRLIPQLSSSAKPVEAYDVESIIAAPGTTLLLARDDDGAIVGTLTVVTFRSPTGARCWIEDVVVDEDARGLGAGEALVEEALDIARRANARSVDLTSNPSREDANRLYQRVGFEQRITNVYRFSLEA
jgi:ribosomal protein S18 acetylase RimI-like enzyme